MITITKSLMLAVLVVLAVFGLQARQVQIPYHHNERQEESDTSCHGDSRRLLADCYRSIRLDSCLKLWRDDPYGCKGQRTLGLMLRLREDLKLDSISLDSMLHLLGQPNELYYDNSSSAPASQDGRSIRAVYYMQGKCIGGAPDYRETIHLRMTLFFHP